MAELRAVLFDVAGTVVSFSGADRATAVVRAEFVGFLGADAPPADVVAEASRQGIARAFAEFFALPFYMHREMTAATYFYAAEALGRPISDAVADRLAARWWDELLRNGAWREGAVETLTDLRRRGLHLGAVTNADEEHLKVFLDVLGLDRYFDAWLSSEGARSCKPDAAIFHQALRQAGCSPEEAIFVGDTPAHDIDGAAGVGMRTVLITDSHAGLGRDLAATHQPDYIIRGLPELLGILA